MNAVCQKIPQYVVITLTLSVNILTLRHNVILLGLALRGN